MVIIKHGKTVEWNTWMLYLIPPYSTLTFDNDCNIKGLLEIDYDNIECLLIDLFEILIYFHFFSHFLIAVGKIHLSLEHNWVLEFMQ